MKMGLTEVKMTVEAANCITRLCVVHPAQDDLWGSVPTRDHVPGHLTVCLPRQTKVQDLRRNTVGYSVHAWVVLQIFKQPHG